MYVSISSLNLFAFREWSIQGHSRYPNNTELVHKSNKKIIFSSRLILNSQKSKEPLFFFSVEVVWYILRDLTTVGNNNFLGGLSTLGTHALQFLNHIKTFYNSTKHHMPVVQPSCFDSCNEELGTIGVGPSIGHGQNTWKRNWILTKLVLSKPFSFKGFYT